MVSVKLFSPATAFFFVNWRKSQDNRLILQDLPHDTAVFFGNSGAVYVPLRDPLPAASSRGPGQGRGAVVVRVAWLDEEARREAGGEPTRPLSSTHPLTGDTQSLPWLSCGLGTHWEPGHRDNHCLPGA